MLVYTIYQWTSVCEVVIKKKKKKKLRTAETSRGRNDNYKVNTILINVSENVVG